VELEVVGKSLAFMSTTFGFNSPSRHGPCGGFIPDSSGLIASPSFGRWRPQSYLEKMAMLEVGQGDWLGCSMTEFG